MKKPYITEEQHHEIVYKFHDVDYPLNKEAIENFMTWTGQNMIDDFIAENCGENWIEVEKFLDEANLIYNKVKEDLIKMFC
jgi:hypothetical protein